MCARRWNISRKEVSKMKIHSHTIWCLFVVFSFSFSFSLSLSRCVCLPLSFLSLSLLFPFFPILHSSFDCLLCFIAAFHEHMFFVSSILMPAFRFAIVCIAHFVSCAAHFCYYKYFICIQIAVLYAYGILMNISSFVWALVFLSPSHAHSLYALHSFNVIHCRLRCRCCCCYSLLPPGRESTRPRFYMKN